MENQLNKNRWLLLISAITEIAKRNFSAKIPLSGVMDPVEAVLITIDLTLQHLKIKFNNTLYIHPEEFIKSYTLIRFSLDKNLKVDRSNEAAHKLFKVTDENLIGRPFKELLHKGSHKEWEKAEKKLPIPNNESLDLQLKFPESKGQVLDAYCSLDHSEYIDGYCLSCHILIFDPGNQKDKNQKLGPFGLNYHDLAIVTELELFIRDSLKEQLLKNSELAEKFGASETKMLEIFKKVYRTTPYAYHKKLRLELARYSLVETTDTVETISIIMGYVDVSHFSLDYKKHFGYPPSENRDPDGVK